MVEEPGEEPQLYRQDTGELICNKETFADDSAARKTETKHTANAKPSDQINRDSQSSNKNAAATTTTTATSTARHSSAASTSSYSSSSKLYKDIDELIDNFKKEYNLKTHRQQSSKTIEQKHNALDVEEAMQNDAQQIGSNHSPTKEQKEQKEQKEEEQELLGNITNKEALTKRSLNENECAKKISSEENKENEDALSPKSPTTIVHNEPTQNKNDLLVKKLKEFKNSCLNYNHNYTHSNFWSRKTCSRKEHNSTKTANSRYRSSSMRSASNRKPKYKVCLFIYRLFETAIKLKMFGQF